MRVAISVISILILIPATLAQTPPSDLLHPKSNAIVGLWLMGQSLCDGSESLPLVTPRDTGWGNLAFKRGVRTWAADDHGADPGARPAGQFDFVPLTAAVRGGLGETMANGLADHLTAATTNYQKPPANSRSRPAYLVAYAGQGGRTIQELSIADISTDPRSPKEKQQGGGYYKTSLDDARRAAAQARAAGRPFHIAALVWMQGEGNGGATGGIMPTRWGTELPRPAGQEWYRDQLIAYRRQWSGDLRAITGQSGEIPLFTYQTLGPAGAAQLMAADQDPHIFLVSPHYMVPSALNSRYGGSRHGDAIHLSADGERWYGEHVAKVARRALHEGEAWQPLRPRAATIDPARTSILVEFTVPRPPLVLDETFLPRQQSALGKGAYASLAGFQVRNATTGAVMPLAEVAVEPPARLRIRLATPLASDGRFHLSCGQPHVAALGKVIAIRPGPPQSFAGSSKEAPPTLIPTTELLLTGLPPTGKIMDPLLDEGVFYVANDLPGDQHARAPVRAVLFEKGTTLLRFEDRELRSAIPFAVGQSLLALRPYPYSNLRDSDPEEALYTFTDPAYGRRQGQPYPLWNWCILFDRFLIAEP